MLKHKTQNIKDWNLNNFIYYKYSRPTRFNNNNLLVFQTAQHVSGNFLPSLRSVRLFYTMKYNVSKLLPAGGLQCRGTAYVFGVKDVARLVVEQHPSRQTHRQCLHAPGHQPATTLVHYTTCRKTQSCGPEDGQKIAQNMLSWLEFQ